MNINVSSWAIHKPTPTILFFILLTLAGLMGFKAMKVQNFPDLNIPIITATAILPGASPEQMENDVARIMEDSIASVAGVKHIKSHLTDGNANITVEFQIEKPVQEALDEVRDAVARVRSDLPPDLLDPIIKKVETAGGAILTYTVNSGTMDDESLSWFVDQQITRKLMSVPGVGLVSRVGGVSREIRVELKPSALLAFNITAAEVSNRLREIQQEAPGGRAKLGDAEQSIRTIATVRSADELAEMQITLNDGRNVRLSQIAEVLDTVAEPRSLALLDGKQVVGFEIVRSRGAGEIDVMHGVRAELEQLRAEHPQITVTEAFNFVDPIAENYAGSMHLLYEGALLAVLVVFFFLRDLRSTLIAAVALPLSVIPTFLIMHWIGFSLDTVSLLSLSLVIGVLVDDAIVEIENISRHLRMGKSPYQAAIDAADEIGLAVIATTFTLIAVFLPTAFMGGVPGKFFVQFGWTAAIAVFFSLVVARMLTPMMAAYILKPSIETDSPPVWLNHYTRWAELCLNYRALTLTIAGVFFVGSFALVPILPTGFIPADDVSQTQITLTLPPGSTLDDTYRAAEQARALVQKHSHVKTVYTAIGGGSSGGSDPFGGGGVADVSQAVLTVSITQREDRRGVSRQAIERDLRKAVEAVPGARIKVGMGDAENLVLVLTGANSENLTHHARTVERELRSLGGIGAVISTASLVRPELIVRPDFALAADLGVTSADIAETLRVATAGDHGQALAKLNVSERQIPIVVRLADELRKDIDILKRLPVPGAQGKVSLENVAILELGSGPSDITRYDRRRNVNIEVELNGRSLGDVEKEAQALSSLQHLPAGVQQSTSGDAEAMGELFTSFGLAMATGVLCIYIVLVLLFNDFVQPLTILTALVVSIPGAFIALFVTHSALSMPSMIGLIMLMGIATKNSILLIDYIIIARHEHGLERWDAVIDACRKRARPIIMTTIAMGAGMLPNALGLGADPSFRAPMAIVVIGGLMTSTFLSLLVIPVIFTFVDDGVQWVRKLFLLSKR